MSGYDLLHIYIYILITRILSIRGTTGIFSITTTRDVIHHVKGTPEAIIASMIVLIVYRMVLSKAMCLGFASLLSDTRKDL